MIINLSDLMKSITDKMEIEFEENIDSVKVAGKEIKIIEPIKVSAKMITDGDVVSFTGVAKTKIEAVCDRCAETFNKDIELDLNETFTNGSYSEDESEYYQINDSTIDFTPIMVQNLMMRAPIKFLCKEDCKGICYKCGKNLNKEQCSCENINEFSPFADLRGMFN